LVPKRTVLPSTTWNRGFDVDRIFVSSSVCATAANGKRQVSRTQRHMSALFCTPRPEEEGLADSERWRLEEALHPKKLPGYPRMADAHSCRPQSEGDGPPRPPTFVQIRPPARRIGPYRKLGIAGLGLALVMAAALAAYRVIDEPAAIEVIHTAAPVRDVPSPQPVSKDLHGELARQAIDSAAFAPVWTRESSIERLSPFDPSVSARAPSAPPAADPGNATSVGSSEISVQLGKGETIGGALQKLGFPADAIADVVSALAPHVKLKRLPVGLDMVVQVGPTAAEDAKPVLQALTLHPEGRREIKVERDSDGSYTVERSERSSRK
jgi:hypothetical protein